MRLTTLTKRKDFLRAAEAGRKCVTRSLVVQAIEFPEDMNSDRPDCRVGYTATKRIGGAVTRNRAKRRMRALARDIIAQHGQKETDYVLIARRFCVQSTYDALCKDLIYALKQVHA